MAWYLPMNFSYGANGLPGNQPTTFDEIFQGQRRSTLRKPGQLPRWVQPGQEIEVRDNQGRTGKVRVTGRRMVTPDMVDELSQVERWSPDFLRSYMRGQSMEQLLYEPVHSEVANAAPTFHPSSTNPTISTAMNQRMSAKEAAAWLLSNINLPVPLQPDEASTAWRVSQANRWKQVAATALGGLDPNELSVDLPNSQTSYRSILAPTGRSFDKVLVVEPTAQRAGFYGPEQKPHTFKFSSGSGSALPVPRYRRTDPQQSNFLARMIYGGRQGENILTDAEKKVAAQMFVDDIQRMRNYKRDDASEGYQGARSNFGPYGTTRQHTVIPGAFGPTIPDSSVLFRQPLAWGQQKQYTLDDGTQRTQRSKLVQGNLNDVYATGDVLSNNWQALPGNPVDVIPIVDFIPGKRGGTEPLERRAIDKQGRFILSPLDAQIFKDQKGVTNVFGTPVVATTTISDFYGPELADYNTEIDNFLEKAEQAGGLDKYLERIHDPDSPATYGLYADELSNVRYQPSDKQGAYWNANRAELSDWGMQEWQTKLLTQGRNTGPERESTTIGRRANQVAKQASEAWRQQKNMMQAASAYDKEGKHNEAAALRREAFKVKDAATVLYQQKDALYADRENALFSEFMGSSQVPQFNYDTRTGTVLTTPSGTATKGPFSILSAPITKPSTEVDLFSEENITPPVYWEDTPAGQRAALAKQQQAGLVAALQEEAAKDLLDKGSAIARLMSVKQYGPSDIVTPFVTDTEGRIQFKNRGGVNIPRVSPRQMKLWDKSPAGLYYGLNPAEVNEVRLALEDEIAGDPFLPPAEYQVGQRVLTDSTRTGNEWMPHGNIEQSSSGFLADAMRQVSHPFVDAAGQDHFMPSSRIVPAGTVVANVRKAPEPVLGVLARGLYSTPHGSSGLYPPMPIRPGMEPQADFTIDSPQLQQNVLVDPNIMRAPTPATGMVGGTSRASIQAAVDRAIEEELMRREGGALESIRDKTGALIAPPGRVFSPEAFAARGEKFRTLKRLFS